MKRIVLGVALLSTLACGGATPFRRENAQSADFGKKIEAEIDPAAGRWHDGRRVEVPADGSVIVKLKQTNPGAVLAVRVFGEGNVPIAQGDATKPVRADDLHQGSFWIVVSATTAQPTHITESIVFKPADPDAAQSAEKTQAGAKEVTDVDGSKLAGTVDYSAMKRTQFWKLIGIAGGSLQIHFNNGAPKGVTAEVMPPGAAAEPIDPVAGWKKDNAPAGDYFVHVFAIDAGDAAQYELAVKYDQGDPCANGGDSCHAESADDLKAPSDTKTGEVDYNKAKAYHWYKLTAAQKGRVTFSFKAQAKGSKVRAEVMPSVDADDGDRVVGSMSKDVEQGAAVLLRVSAPNRGDASKYTLTEVFQAANFINGKVVENDKHCGLTVQAGSNQGVRAGVGCTVVNSSGQPLGTAVVDQAFPNMSKVRMLGQCSMGGVEAVQIPAM